MTLPILDTATTVTNTQFGIDNKQEMETDIHDKNNHENSQRNDLNQKFPVSVKSSCQQEIINSEHDLT